MTGDAPARDRAPYARAVALLKRAGFRRVAAIVVLVTAALITLLAAVMVVGCYRSDAAIDKAPATADAEVLSVTFKRTIVRFESADGKVQIPKDGVLYPADLAEGQRLLVEYAADNPEVVRVAGRTAAMSLLPGGTTVLFTWLAAGPLLWLVRPRKS